MADPEKVRFALGYEHQPDSREYDCVGTRRRPRRRLIALLVAILLLGDAYLVWTRIGFVRTLLRQFVSTQECSPAKDVLPVDPLMAFDWASLKSSKKLHWTSCFDRFECARLDVPLDYSDPSGDRASVALIKFPSTIPAGENGYRGPVLFNPGGPGGSGVATVLALADAFRAILGDGFDLIGFDPRGVGLTTPTLASFESTTEAGEFILQTPWNSNASNVALGSSYASFKLLGSLVEERQLRSAQHVSTPIVARDMLSIVQAYGRDKLQYWGFSYGTVLGATFAAMFPDNIERLILDGVVDTDDYYSASWFNNMRDTNTTLFDLYHACVKAGPSTCPLYEETAELVHLRVDRILNKLKDEPVPFFSKDANAYSVVDFESAKAALFITMYNTHGAGAYILAAFALLEQGNVEAIWQTSTRRIAQTLLTCDCTREPSRFGGLWDTSFAIACGEGDVITDGVPELTEFYRKLARTSYFADSWNIHSGCAAWRVRTKAPFKGSFIQNTSHPILFIGNTADPVTPLWNAHKMSKGFNQSVVLTQDSPGHCSVSAASLCTARAIRAYFRTGTLPEPGKVCGVESSIFGGDALNVDFDTLSAEDQQLLHASNWLHLNAQIRFHGFPLPLSPFARSPF